MAPEIIIALGGRNIGLLFGLPSNKYWEDYKKSPLANGQEVQLDAKDISHVLYAGYINHCEAEAQLPDLTFRAFHDFVEEAALDGNMDLITKAVLLFFHSRTELTQKAIKRVAENDATEKKSSIGKKLKSSVPAKIKSTRK